MSDGKNKLIRNSTAEFFIFTGQAGEQSIEARYEDETIWLTQKLMAELFAVTVPTINEHLKNIFVGGELDQDSVIRKFRITAADGKNYATNFYNLDAIISVGYRVNSVRATQFRQWATQVLREFAIKGYVLDKQRMENGAFLGEDYFERLLAEIREIRLSERKFYQKITDISATSVDYNKDAPTTKAFFAKVQNKLHWPHRRRVDHAAGRQRKGAHGADLVGEFAKRQDTQNRCRGGQELPHQGRTGIPGPDRQCLSRISRRTGAQENPHDHGRLGQEAGCLYRFHGT